jgi:hypothetical protein
MDLVSLGRSLRVDLQKLAYAILVKVIMSLCVFYLDGSGASGPDDAYTGEAVAEAELYTQARLVFSHLCTEVRFMKSDHGSGNSPSKVMICHMRPWQFDMHCRLARCCSSLPWTS